MDTTAKALVSPSDIADLAGVKRPVVSNWRKRHKDFPTPIAGTTARPLFGRDAVASWLRGRGYTIEDPGSEGRVWTSMNAIRGFADVEEMADLVLFMACLKRADPTEFAAIASAAPESQTELLRTTARGLASRRGWQFFDDDALILPNVREGALSLVIAAVDGTADGELPEVVDAMLERLTRSQIRSGAEFGFIGSRASSLLASLAGPTAGTVYDPACGIGDVLIQVAKQSTPKRLVGSEINRRALRIAAQRAFLHGLDAIEFIAADVLSDDPVADLRADVILGDPPLGARWEPAPRMSDPRFVFGLPPKASSDLAWVQHSIAHLAPGGRAYVLTLPGTLFRAGAERRIRANLLSSGCVAAVVSLPNSFLPNTAIGPALWALRPPTEDDQVLLIDAAEVANVEAATAEWLGGLGTENRPDIDAPHACVPVADIIAADAVLTPGRWVCIPLVDEDTIATSFVTAYASMLRTVRRLEAAPFLHHELADLPTARIVTVKELVDAGMVELRIGRTSRSPEREPAEERRLVRPSAIRNKVLPPLDQPTDVPEPELTAKHDVLVAIVDGVSAVVDESGGRILAAGTVGLRVTDTSLIVPGYLSAVLPGSWNSRLQTGTTVRRAPIRDLEVPLLPASEQRRVLAAMQKVTALRQEAENLAAHAVEVESATLDALRYDVELESPPTDAAPDTSRGRR